VLNGIGGRTIAEAKERMSYAEAQDWAEYIERRGSINLGKRMEYGFALVGMLISRATGGKATMKDFMPHSNAVSDYENEEVASPSTVLAFFKRFKKKG
jgi:hypothetical protein